MSDAITGLDDWAAKAMGGLDAGARRRLARDIATRLRRANQQRIAAQVDPDGNPFDPRRPQKARAKSGRIKRRAMFAKLRQSRHLRIRADASAATVEFTSRVARVARVHHEGLEDSVKRGGPRVRYASRRLLGIPDRDRDLVAQAVMDALSRATV